MWLKEASTKKDEITESLQGKKENENELLGRTNCMSMLLLRIEPVVINREIVKTTIISCRVDVKLYVISHAFLRFIREAFIRYMLATHKLYALHTFILFLTYVYNL